MCANAYFWTFIISNSFDHFRHIGFYGFAVCRFYCFGNIDFLE